MITVIFIAFVLGPITCREAAQGCDDHEQIMTLDVCQKGDPAKLASGETGFMPSGCSGLNHISAERHIRIYDPLILSGPGRDLPDIPPRA